MDHGFLKKIAQRVIAERIALVLALIIGVILAIAAWGKFFHPAEWVKTMDHWVSGFELLFLLTIVLFRKHRLLWLSSAVVFAAWCGYALYWYFLKLPCSCMGAMLNIPTAFSIALDLFFFISSLITAYLLGTRPRWIYFTVLTGLIAALLGYAFADWIYHHSIIKV